MQFCISITDPVALEKWKAIPKQKRSKYVEEMLLRESVQEELVNKIKNALAGININCTNEKSNAVFDDALIDEILNM